MSHLSEHECEAAIEAALRSEPLAPAPTGLYVAVMRRVSVAAPPPFRLDWLDYAISAFLATMVGVIILLGQMSQALGLGQADGQTTLLPADALGTLWLGLSGLLLVSALAVALALGLIRLTGPPAAR